MTRRVQVVLACACLAGACENLLGLEHGVPAPAPGASGGLEATGGGGGDESRRAAGGEDGSIPDFVTAGTRASSKPSNGGQGGDAPEVPQAGQGSGGDCSAGPELCDGLDNDCDGAIDLADGLEPGGQTLPLATGQAAYPRIAFSRESSRFAALWMQGLGSEAQLMFSLLSPADEQAPAPLVLEPVPGLYDHVLTTAGTGFATAWIDQDFVVHARFVAADGTPDPNGAIVVSALDGLASNLAMVDGGDELIVFWSEIPTGMMARTLSLDGQLGPAISVLGSPNTGSASAAASDDYALLVWPQVVDTDGAVLIFKGNLAAQVGVSVPTGGSVVGAGSGGFGVAGTLGDHAVFTRFDGPFDGSAVKAACQVPLPLSSAYVNAIAATRTGFVIAAGRGEVELVEVTAACRVLQHWVIDAGISPATTVTYPNITSAAELGFGLVWTKRWHASNPPGLLARRFFGPNFCD